MFFSCSLPQPPKKLLMINEDLASAFSMALSMVYVTYNGCCADFSRFPTSLKLSLDVNESLAKWQKQFSKYDTSSKGKNLSKEGFQGNFCLTDVFVKRCQTNGSSETNRTSYLVLSSIFVRTVLPTFAF